MIHATKSSKTLTVNGRKIEFEQSVDALVVLDDRVIIHLYVSDFAVGDALVGRNILAFDANGDMLWRIPATGVIRGKSPEAFFGLWLDDDGKVKTGTANGFDWELDLDTGKISNPVFTK